MGSSQNPSPRHSHAAKTLPWPKRGFQSWQCPLAAAAAQGSPLATLLGTHPSAASLARAEEEEEEAAVPLLRHRTQEPPQQRCWELCRVSVAFGIWGEKGRRLHCSSFIVSCFLSRTDSLLPPSARLQSPSSPRRADAAAQASADALQWKRSQKRPRSWAQPGPPTRSGDWICLGVPTAPSRATMPHSSWSCQAAVGRDSPGRQQGSHRRTDRLAAAKPCHR